MIKVDLSVPHSRKKMTVGQFILLFLGIFLGVTLILVVGLLLKWNSLSNIADDRDELKNLRDSLSEAKAEMISYKDLRNHYNELITVQTESMNEQNNLREILSLLYIKLEPGMKLLACRIDSDSVVANCLSPSNVKVARYMEALSESELIKVDRSEPQGTRQGLIEHRVLLRVQ